MKDGKFTAQWCVYKLSGKSTKLYLEGHKFESCRGLRYFICPTLISTLIFTFTIFIPWVTNLKINFYKALIELFILWGLPTQKRFLHKSSLTKFISDEKVPMWWEPDSSATVKRDSPMLIMASELCLMREITFRITVHFTNFWHVVSEVCLKFLKFSMNLTTSSHSSHTNLKIWNEVMNFTLNFHRKLQSWFTSFQ